MNTPVRTWYITLIASYYLVICALTSLYYLLQDLAATGATIPWSIQLLCFAAAISAGAYFINPSVGHRGLLIVTLLTLLGIGEGDPGATRFHVVILAILLLPLIRRRYEPATGCLS